MEARGEEVEEEDETFEETLGWADSLAFPVLGSIALLGLWALLRYVGKEWINFVLGIYCKSPALLLAVYQVDGGEYSLGCRDVLVARGESYFGPLHILLTKSRPLALSSPFCSDTHHIQYRPIISGSPPVSNVNSILFSDQTARQADLSPGYPTEIFHLPIQLPTLLLLPISILLPALYVPLGRPYILSNTLALCLSTSTLALLRLDSFFTAFLLLAVLLVYDIFWVSLTSPSSPRTRRHASDPRLDDLTLTSSHYSGLRDTSHGDRGERNRRAHQDSRFQKPILNSIDRIRHARTGRYRRTRTGRRSMSSVRSRSACYRAFERGYHEQEFVSEKVLVGGDDELCGRTGNDDGSYALDETSAACFALSQSGMQYVYLGPMWTEKC